MTHISCTQTPFDLHTHTFLFYFIQFVCLFLHLAWKFPTPMLLFSLVSTTAADSCGDGNATATATSEARIMTVFILLLIDRDVCRCVWVNTDFGKIPHGSDGVRLKTVENGLIIDKSYVAYFIVEILAIILQREMVRLFHRFDSMRFDSIHLLLLLRCFKTLPICFVSRKQKSEISSVSITKVFFWLA